ncbi:DUF1850 domain-containing protein [Virgibacillus ndiopensis]|uniref:DUF1850 domain-containing protein n=1 Tax=Virgibacillus ndiopensis TaxID=2004408 RepID=UPI000C0863CA|nr:DUF1850 domain-containing protein [Virgibacillus ndiopensis]
MPFFKKIITIIITILFCLSLLFFPVQALTVSNENQFSYAFLLNNNSFSIHWIHSVEKEEWVENFNVHGNVINLDSTKFKTFGAGVPSWSEEPTVIKDGWVYMDIEREIGQELVIRTVPINNYQVEFDNDLYPLMPSDFAYKIEAKKTPFINVVWTYLKKL